ncbi:hypothetical protein BHMPCIPO_04900 [Ensifer sesbaniae]|nr:hypothetical protein [Ensifer sesbaniae]
MRISCIHVLEAYCGARKNLRPLPVDCAPEWSNWKQHRFANERAMRDRTGISRDGLILLAAPGVLIATTGLSPGERVGYRSETRPASYSRSFLSASVHSLPTNGMEMPHIAVKMFPGRTEEQKQDFAARVAASPVASSSHRDNMASRVSKRLNSRISARLSVPNVSNPQSAPRTSEGSKR